MAWVVVVLAAVVVVHPSTTAVVRWADDRAVRRPPGPRCVDDTHGLRLAELVPVWSWLRARGRCRTCDARIPVSLPVVEVVVPVVLLALAWRHPGPVLVLLAPVAWSAVVATPIDLHRRIIPNRLTYPLAAWSLGSATVLAVATGDWADWRRAVTVGLVLATGMLVLSLAFQLVRGQPGMGLGDIKWSVSLGTAVGWLGAGAVTLFLCATIVAAGLVAIVLLATGRAGTSRIPFGPYLALGVLAALLLPTSWVVSP